ncbi:MAG: [acyl-carrier-protein] S-malonyltransferase [Acidobacteria bacterium]|nr:MAG: [acyl-carrier-protein] S-malonyltransferase [Acidobacteriota bacterium]
MSEIAFLFPGQGSQAPGMGLELAQHFASAREVFEEAEDALGFPLSKLCFEGPAELLQLTANTQPAILAVSVAATRVLEEKGVRPDYVAGHSLGEYSALVAARSIGLSDALRLVRKRGEYMQEAVPVGKGAMAALLGLEAGAIDEICRDAAGDEVVSAANLNSPAQIVIAGHRAAVERAVELAKARGAKRAILLNVSAPFHSSLMKPAADRLAVDLDAVAISDPQVPLVNNADASIVRSAEAVRDGLKRQVTSPVRWTDSMLALRREGAGFFVEAGPGKVLSGLMRQIIRDAPVWQAGDLASLEEVVGAVQPQ